MGPLGPSGHHGGTCAMGTVGTMAGAIQRPAGDAKRQRTRLGATLLGIRIKHMIHVLELWLVLVPVWRELTQTLNYTWQHL